MTEFGDVMLQRIAEALEKIVISIQARAITYSLKEEGEKSVVDFCPKCGERICDCRKKEPHSLDNTDSKPLPEKTIGNKKPLDHNKEDLKLDIFVAYETDKAYLVENDHRLQAWIPKKATVDINVNEFNIGSIVIAHWFKEKVEFKQPEKR